MTLKIPEGGFAAIVGGPEREDGIFSQRSVHPAYPIGVNAQNPYSR